MDKKLTYREILSLGFMIFALLVGSGNIIYPPQVGAEAGENLWYGGLGFLLSGVGLPILTLVAIVRMQGSIEILSKPLGRVAGLIFATACYLFAGPLFPLPRTAAVSFDVGIGSFFTDSIQISRFIYSAIYFIIVTLLAVFPGRFLSNIGQILAPIKIIFFLILTCMVFFLPATDIQLPAINKYVTAPFTSGFIDGYLTLDSFGSLVFGVLIFNAMRHKKITSAALITRYTIFAGIIAGLCLIMLYIGLFKLGSVTGALAPETNNGAVLLRLYVEHILGLWGSVFLAFLVFLVCLSTAVGLISAASAFLCQYARLSYRNLVILNALFSFIAANQGLTQLTRLIVPLLMTIYPVVIVLVLLSFTKSYWNNSAKIYIPVIAVSLICGLLDGLKTIHFYDGMGLLLWLEMHLPLVKQNMAWLLPVTVTLAIAAIVDKSQQRSVT